MPCINVYETAKRIKKQAKKEGHVAPKIIAVTADAFGDSLSEENSLEFLDGFIAKTLDIRDIHKKLYQALNEISVG